MSINNVTIRFKKYLQFAIFYLINIIKELFIKFPSNSQFANGEQASETFAYLDLANRRQPCSFTRWLEPEWIGGRSRGDRVPLIYHFG